MKNLVSHLLALTLHGFEFKAKNAKKHVAFSTLTKCKFCDIILQRKQAHKAGHIDHIFSYKLEVACVELEGPKYQIISKTLNQTQNASF